MTEINSQASWDQAKQIVSLIGETPPPFATCVRFLRADMEKNKNVVGKFATYCLRRLLNSTSLRSSFYYAALTFRSERLPEVGNITAQVLIDAFNAEELSYILAFIYLHRRIQRGCNKSAWDQFTTTLVDRADIGGWVGQAIPKIGFGRGLSIGLIRDLGSAMFLGIDEKQFLKYRRTARQAGQSYDLAEETRLWGCHHVQVASLLLQTVCLGLPVAQAIARGLLSVHRADDSDIDAYALRTGEVWLQSLLKDNTVPNMVHSGDYYPREVDLQVLQSKVEKILAQGSEHSWLTKGKKDISPQTTPFLFTDQPEEPDELLDPELNETFRKLDDEL